MSRADRGLPMEMTFEGAVELLEQLHTLAQTETLIIEARNPDDLIAVAEAKAQLVNRLLEVNDSIHCFTQSTSRRRRPELSDFKLKALQLIERISRVEEGNLKRLESAKQEVIQRSRALQDDRRLLSAYGQLDSTNNP
ncbi:MAG TPA: hypothetical protein VFY29_05715 [Terriglobia bacterium]|nr:hypothetical protein [Terriglobia bacterium]